MSEYFKTSSKRALSLLLALVLTWGIFPVKKLEAISYANPGDSIKLVTTYRLRSGAGTSFSTIGNAYANSSWEVKARVTGENFSVPGYSGNVWYKVIYNGKTAYIVHDVNHTIIRKTNPSPTPTVKPQPTATPTPAPAPTGGLAYGFSPAKPGDTVTLAATYNIRSQADVKAAIIGSLNSGASFTVQSTVVGATHHGGNYWYKFILADKTGYLAADEDQLITPKASDNVDIDLPYEDNSISTTYSPEEWKQVLASFPPSYHAGLNALHKKYPAWKFEAEYHDFSLEYAANLEKSYNGRNLVPYYFGSNYRDMSDGRMYDAGGWYAANWDTIAFVMDPRNWLTEKYIFMYEKMGEVKDIPVNSAIKRLSVMFEGNHDLINMIPAIINASKDHEVNPVFTGSRIMTEVRIGNTISASAKGTLKISQSTINALGDPNFNPDLSKTYYNVFNIGAYDGTNPQANGILYAMGYGVSPQKQAQLLIPWDSQYKAIYGGLSFIKADYIGNRQNNNYYMKFNMRWPKSQLPSRIYHQYMTSVVAPVTEAVVQYEANKGAGTLEEPFTFLIPVYQDMTNNQYKNPGTWYYDYSKNQESMAPGNNVNLSDFQITEAKPYSQTGDTVKLGAAFWLRSYPNNVYGNGISVIDQGESVEILERVSGVYVDGYTDQWYKVRYGSKVGYIIAYPPAQTITASKYERVDFAESYKGDVVIPKPTATPTPKPTPIPTTKPSPKPTVQAFKTGDANRDGVVNIVDATYIALYVIGEKEFTAEMLKAADANKDGKVNIVDATYVALYVIGERKLD